MPKPPSPFVMLTLMVDILAGSNALLALPSSVAPPPRAAPFKIRTSAERCLSTCRGGGRWLRGSPDGRPTAETPRGPPPRTQCSLRGAPEGQASRRLGAEPHMAGKSNAAHLELDPAEVTKVLPDSGLGDNTGQRQGSWYRPR